MALKRPGSAGARHSAALVYPHLDLLDLQLDLQLPLQYVSFDGVTTPEIDQSNEFFQAAKIDRMTSGIRKTTIVRLQAAWVRGYPDSDC